MGHVDSMGLFEQGVGYEGPQSDSPALQNDEWWNNDWTDWFNPFAYAAGAGDRVGGVRELPPYDSREGLKISGFAMLMPHANFDGNPVDPNSYLGLRQELGLERVPAGPDEEFYDDVKQIPLLGSGTQFLYGETIRPGETRKGAWRLAGDVASSAVPWLASIKGSELANSISRGMGYFHGPSAPDRVVDILRSMGRDMSRHDVKNAIHYWKDKMKMGPKDDLIFDYSGGIWDSRTGEYIDKIWER